MAETVKKASRAAGFDLCGITTPEPVERDSARYFRWLKKGLHGEMRYLSKDPQRRSDPRLVFPSTRSVIVLALNYYRPNDGLDAGHGRVARYARGKDYHKVFEKRMKQLIQSLCESDSTLDPRDDFKAYVDYGPILERAYAEKAGLGYIGRNSLLITEEFGSWVLLGAILTSLALEPDEPNQSRHGHCGSCRRCLDYCPTGAIIAPGVVDARKCISYLTIEKRGEVEEELRKKVGDNLFGCDICQEVCPFNHPNNRPRHTGHDEFLPGRGVGESIDLQEILRLDSEEEFLNIAAGTPLTRPGLAGLKRNARMCLDSRGDS